jgi:hypothetical protein
MHSDQLSEVADECLRINRRRTVNLCREPDWQALNRLRKFLAKLVGRCFIPSKLGDEPPVKAQALKDVLDGELRIADRRGIALPLPERFPTLTRYVRSSQGASDPVLHVIGMGRRHAVD